MTEGRGRDASQELTEVRTVLSRAETAINRIEGMLANPHRWSDENDHRYGGNAGYDPDADDMITALRVVVELLGRWRKTGSTKRWV